MASIEMIGFLAFQFFGKRRGILVQGFIGGFISSTMIYIQFGEASKMSAYSSRDVVGGLILSTIAMLSLSVLLVITLSSRDDFYLTYPFLMQIVGLFFCLFLITSLTPATKSKSEENIFYIEDPIIWKNVLKFTFFLTSITFGLKWLTNLIPDSYLISSFVISLFESHAVLAAFLSNIETVGDHFNPKLIVSLILLGSLISKIFLISRSKMNGIKKPVYLSLIGSFLLSLTAYLF